MRILLDGKRHTSGDLIEVRNEHLEEDPSFDALRLSYDPIELAAEDAAKRRAALAQINTLHAKALVLLTGDATVEERDTWPVKIAAAEAIRADSASNAQKAMLSAEVGELQEDIEALANTIIFKSEMYQRVVGIAAKLRADGKRSLEGVDTNDLPAALKEIERKSNLYVLEKAAEMGASNS